MKAFPIPEHTKKDYEFPPQHEGMDLRDYFAAKAMHGVNSFN